MQINSCVKMICLHKWNGTMALNAYQILSSNLKLRHVFVNRPQRACVQFYNVEMPLMQVTIALWAWKTKDAYIRAGFVSHSHYVALNFLSSCVEHSCSTNNPHRTVHIHLHTYLILSRDFNGYWDIHSERVRMKGERQWAKDRWWKRASASQ